MTLDIFWLRDESLEDSDRLPAPDVLALEIAEDLEAALELFQSITENLEAKMQREVISSSAMGLEFRLNRSYSRKKGSLIEYSPPFGRS